MSVMTETEFQRRLVQLCERLTEEEKAEWRQTLYSWCSQKEEERLWRSTVKDLRLDVVN